MTPTTTALATKKIFNVFNVQVPGMAEMARAKVRTYFAELHETLQRQEEVAASVLDTHIRERLHLLRQQQEHFAFMNSSIASMSYECESMLYQVGI